MKKTISLTVRLISLTVRLISLTVRLSLGLLIYIYKRGKEKRKGKRGNLLHGKNFAFETLFAADKPQQVLPLVKVSFLSFLGCGKSYHTAGVLEIRQA